MDPLEMPEAGNELDLKALKEVMKKYLIYIFNWDSELINSYRPKQRNAVVIVPQGGYFSWYAMAWKMSCSDDMSEKVSSHP